MQFDNDTSSVIKNKVFDLISPEYHDLGERLHQYIDFCCIDFGSDIDICHAWPITVAQTDKIQEFWDRFIDEQQNMENKLESLQITLSKPNITNAQRTKTTNDIATLRGKLRLNQKYIGNLTKYL
jgi:hypothetical protein